MKFTGDQNKKPAFLFIAIRQLESRFNFITIYYLLFPLKCIVSVPFMISGDFNVVCALGQLAAVANGVRLHSVVGNACQGVRRI